MPTIWPGNEVAGPPKVDTAATKVMGLLVDPFVCGSHWTYMYDYSAHAPMVPGNTYTASVWARTSQSGQAARVQAYTCANAPNDFGRVWAAKLPVEKARESQIVKPPPPPCFFAK